jgi:hypothetical protein
MLVNFRQTRSFLLPLSNQPLESFGALTKSPLGYSGTRYLPALYFESETIHGCLLMLR